MACVWNVAAIRVLEMHKIAFDRILFAEKTSILAEILHFRGVAGRN